MRAEKVFVELPPFVRRRGEASREEIPFVFAQTADVSDFFEHSRDFFFHKRTLILYGCIVESEIEPRGIRSVTAGVGVSPAFFSSLCWRKK